MEAETTGSEYGTTGASSGYTDAADADVDWEGERRWHDRPWFFVAVLIGGGCAVITSGIWLMGAQSASVFGAAWLVGAMFCGWLAWHMRRKIARQIGVSGWQLPVVARRVQKERVPRDPAVRRAMALLARRQRKQMRSARWMWPALAALYLLSAVTQWAGGATGMAAFWVGLAAASCATYFQYRRAIARADRVLSRLGEDAVPSH